MDVVGCGYAALRHAAKPGVLRETMKAKVKTHISFSNSRPLLDAAEFLFSNANDQSGGKLPNRHAFILAVAAFMEARLNEALNDWGKLSGSLESGAKHAAAFLTMSLRAKLDTIFFIYSSGGYATNIDSKEYGHLSRLIAIRNQVAHAKPFNVETDIEFHEQEDGSQNFQLPAELIEKAEGKIGALETKDLLSMLDSVKELDRALGHDFVFSDSPLCSKVE